MIFIFKFERERGERLVADRDWESIEEGEREVPDRYWASMEEGEREDKRGELGGRLVVGWQLNIF